MKIAALWPSPHSLRLMPEFRIPPYEETLFFDLANESLRLETFRYRWLNAYPVHSSRLRSILPSAPRPMLRGCRGMYFLHPSAYEVAKTRPAVQNRPSQSKELYGSSLDHPRRDHRLVCSFCCNTASAPNEHWPRQEHSCSTRKPVENTGPMNRPHVLTECLPLAC